MKGYFPCAVYPPTPERLNCAQCRAEFSPTRSQWKDICRRESSRAFCCLSCYRDFQVSGRAAPPDPVVVEAVKKVQRFDVKVDLGKPLIPPRKCHDCKKPTRNYRCEKCTREWRRVYEVTEGRFHGSEYGGSSRIPK